MPGCKWFFVALCVLVLLTPKLPAQVVLGDRPLLLVPLKPATQKDVDRRDSLKQYALGLLCEKEDRLIEALNAFQQAAKLDADAPAVFKAQVPLFIALDRGAEALAASSKVVELDPADYESWYIHSRLLKATSKLADARQALQRGLETDVAKIHPELAQQMFFDLGTILESEGSVKQAADAFAQSAKILDQPDHILDMGPFTRDMVLNRAAEVYERIGHLYRKVKQYDLAVDAFKKAQARFPAAAGRLNFNVAQVLVEQDNLGQALTALDGYLRFQPQGLEAYEMKIGLMQRLQRTKEIVPWLEQAVQADQYNVRLRLLLANQYAQDRQAFKAEKLFLELGEKSPDAAVYKGLFNLYKQEANLGMPKALALLNQTMDRAGSKEPGAGPNVAASQARAMIGALREDLGLSKELLRMGLQRLDLKENELKFETVHFLAVLADRQRQNDEAERFYRQCLKDAQPPNEAIVYGGLLRVLWKAHKYEAVLQVCREGLKNARATNRILFHNDLAKGLARLEQYKEALQEVNKAVELAGDNDRLAVKHLRVRILVQASQFKEAEGECMGLLKEHALPGELMEIHYLLSSVYTAAKQLAKAEEHLDWILRIDPNNATANNDLGYLWADQGKNLPQAEEMIRKAIEQERRQRKSSPNLTQDVDQDNAAYLDSLGWVLFRRGKIDDAKKELEKAASQPDGDDSTIWDHLGDVYFRLRLLPQAQNAYQKALTLYRQERRQPDARFQDIGRKLELVKQQTANP